ncbi:MAG: hypothetical protein E7E52_08035, partial [Streptococcus salivarius]|nr:hypothetical protein [Streptococcus salivarius]
MNKKNKANQTAQLSLLIATMVVIEVLSQTIFAAFVLPIKPTLTHIPVIIASIVYGPKIGAYLAQAGVDVVIVAKFDRTFA